MSFSLSIILDGKQSYNGAQVAYANAQQVAQGIQLPSNH